MRGRDEEMTGYGRHRGRAPLPWTLAHHEHEDEGGVVGEGVEADRAGGGGGGGDGRADRGRPGLVAGGGGRDGSGLLAPRPGGGHRGGGGGRDRGRGAGAPRGEAPGAGPEVDEPAGGQEAALGYLSRLPLWMAALAVAVALVAVLAQAVVDIAVLLARAVGDTSLTAAEAAARAAAVLAALPLTAAERGARLIRSRAPMDREP